MSPPSSIPAAAATAAPFSCRVEALTSPAIPRAFLRWSDLKTLNQYLMDEHVAAIIDPSRSGDGGTVFVQGGGPYKPGDPAGVPSLVMAIENYGRISRLLDRNI